MHGCLVAENAALNTVTMCGCWETRPIARHSRSKLRRSRSSTRPNAEHLQGDAPVEVPLPGAEDVAEPAPADRPEVIEPVDVDGRDGGIDGPGHG